MTLETIVLETAPDPTASIIWLHGLGADAHDFEPIVPELALPSTLPVRFIFPNAPMRAITAYDSMLLRAWYDLASLEFRAKTDRAGIEASVQAVLALVSEEIARGIPANKILLAGFSQGGAIALQAALETTNVLAGVIGLSTYLPLPERLNSETSTHQLPIFLAHGTLDPVVPFSLGEQTCQQFQAAGFAPQFLSYPMAHCVCEQEISALGAWIQARLT